MQKYFKCFICLVSILFPSSEIYAQIDKEQNEILKRRAAEKVALMNDYISYMADKSKKEDTRLYYRGKALNLFIAKGLDYEEDGIQKKGVIMQITSKTYNTVTDKLMREYFWNLIKGLNYYTQIEISATDAASMKVSDLRHIGNNVYECTCQYIQIFTGLRDGKVVYTDRTTKRIKCRVLKEDTEDGTEYVVLLGDVYAISTE